MKTIEIPRRARAVHALLTQASEENLILRTPDGREFVLAEVDDFADEVERTSQNKELMALLESRRVEKATITLNEAKAKLGLR